MHASTSSSTTRPQSWLLRRPVANSRLRLVCFAYAGGSPAPFLGWQQRLGSNVEVVAVQLPGRGTRLPETPVTNVETAIDQLLPVLMPLLDRPVALFGHSLGGLLAFELARRCQRMALHQVSRLYLSACTPPHVRADKERALHTLRDADLIEALREYNGTPEEILADANMMQIALPRLRADFAMAANYVPSPGPRLAIKTTVLFGTTDPYVIEADLLRWSDLTMRPPALRSFEGDHFFIDSGAETVVDWLREDLLGASGPMPVRPAP